jgi:hypothetical protein
MKAIIGVAIAFVIVGGLVGYGVSNMQIKQATDKSFADGQAYQQSLTPTTPTGVPASLDISFADEVFDHSATVAADGSVAADTDNETTVTIENTDDTKTATDVMIMLWNPVSDKKGLDSELKVTETYVYLEVGGLSKALYNDEEYKDGYLVGDLEPGDKVTVTIHVTLLEADEDTFVDGQTYDDCKLYVYQSTINYADGVSFTIET